MITPSQMRSAPSPSSGRLNVVDAGDGENWRILNRPDLTDYKIFNYAGFKAAYAIDPSTGEHSVVYLDYPKAVWGQDELATNSVIKKKLNDCLICNTMDQLSSLGNDQQNLPAVPERVAQPYYHPEDNQQNGGSGGISVGEVITPRYVQAATQIGKKVFCTKLGDVTSSFVLSALMDLLSGWSSDPGQKQAFKQLSNSFIDDLDVQNPEDVSQLKSDAQRLYDSYTKNGDMWGAVRKGMLRGVDQVLGDVGIQANVEVNTPRAAIGVYAQRAHRPSLLD
jgi:hypothetical protein